MEPQVQWIAPFSLWQGYMGAAADAGRASLHQPHILRYATDSFMDEFARMLHHEPERMAEWVAQPEEWRAPTPDPARINEMPPLFRRLHRMRLVSAAPLERITAALAPSNQTPPRAMTVSSGDDLPLKLYQPAHMRFYLVTACLVCRVPGLPDRMLNFGSGERVSYVVRRLRPKAGTTPGALVSLTNYDEYAFVNGSEWQLTGPDRLVPGEERNPLFGVTYQEHDGRKRRVLAAPIPVSKRETYMAASIPRLMSDPDAADLADFHTRNALFKDPRVALFKRTITEPWRSIYDQARQVLNKSIQPNPGGLVDDENAIDDIETNLGGKLGEQADWLSWLVLLDLSDFIEKYLPAVWNVMNEPANRGSLNPHEIMLLDKMLAAAYTSGGVRRTLVDALIDIRAFRNGLEGETKPYTESASPSPGLQWPNFKFRLNGESPLAENLLSLAGLPRSGADSLIHPNLDDWVMAALPAEDSAPVPPLPLAARMMDVDMEGEAWFIIRCVFERPNCVPVIAEVVSDASEPFQLAAFFDPKAPARPIRVTLPFDVTPAGLRKFDRNTAFVISDALCKQISRMGSYTLGDLVMAVLPWPLHKNLDGGGDGTCQEGGLDIGMICSLSIPIVTICALILLMIMVSLLDSILRWLPFFIMCFPVPKLKAKGA